ncbi:amino acid/amide ABC transporter membrane protein 1 (HAAT family) [Actinocorallia herbida]|uniref:Amino acid/amide ABC transporter membrane protein 1 (HAAT family) n=1 Tax=Actinocorallia herbida TaxID=58109 RepID=A0A3N1CNU4_9ACTN|nr:branched-chain amino acid ABC transporter permease [Actinocorallia herbida]ROO82999.1 amino acid/amide ABC transporter membrane protein 1 (HAAT family) [Actinocorallia herbida]
MSLTELMQLITSGVVLGAMYGLIAVGYTMVYGIVQLINFAHGEIFMLGGFGALAMYAWIPPLQHMSLWLALPIMLIGGVAISVLAAVGAERFAYRPLRNAPRLAPLITAIGLAIFVQQLVFLYWPTNGADGLTLGAKQPQVFPQLPGEALEIGGVTLQWADVLTLVLALVAMLVLAYFVRRTRTGRAMQATAQDPDTAGLMGIDTDRIIVIAFVIGASLAAVAGLAHGLRYGQLTYEMGFIAGLKAFTAAVLGGIGNVYGAMLGGIVLGVVESLAAGGLGYLDAVAQFGGGAWKDVWAFVILILVLLVRPQGLLGERTGDRA